MESINWIGAVVGAIAAFGLGAVWYSPAVFGRRWQAAHLGFEVREQSGRQPPLFRVVARRGQQLSEGAALGRLGPKAAGDGTRERAERRGLLADDALPVLLALAQNLVPPALRLHRRTARDHSLPPRGQLTCGMVAKAAAHGQVSRFEQLERARECEQPIS